jgi:nucleotide-binding universal stress UspA family protein
MTGWQILALVLGVCLGGAVGVWAGHRPFTREPHGAGTVSRILLPFSGTAISRRALDAALRLARAEDATLMPAFLATVPKTLPLDAALPSQCANGMPVLEAIEQLAARQAVPVDSRVSRGRTYRHALERLLDAESFDRVVVPASGEEHRAGLSGEDLVWLLRKAPAEVVILRPDPTDRMKVSGAGIRGHF